MEPAITLDVLPAGFGDCLLVSCPVPGRTWRMLVDTGPDETYPALRRRLLAIPPGADGRRHIDLFVVTHIDHDHIGGAHLLLGDADLLLSFGDVWFNAPPRRRVRGVAEGETLSRILGAPETALPWNRAWDGEAVVTPTGQGGVEIAADGCPRLTVLSPTPERLQALWKVWAKELEKLRRKERDKAEAEAERAPTRAGLDLEALARKPTALDRAVPNGASIAILLEHQGASVLLSGDAFANVLVPEIQALAIQRGQQAGAPLAVDLLKLSHHGSRANVTTDVLKAVDARHHVVSTNNAYFKHPNAEAMARVITGSRQPVLWFNYDTPQNRQWDDPGLMQRYGYEVRYPASGESEVDGGVVITLQGTKAPGTRTPRRLRS
jgi:beta-lactamase superfamily II metal-dependent hydrolase